ncbi:MAG: DUF302 domain-containing protein [Gemmatimonadales bacterium]
MVQRTTNYGLNVEISLSYNQAVARVRDELAKEGFGILTEIDVAATLKQKLDVDFRPYLILGACNPPLAHQALSLERDIGLLLPCNVIVYEADSPERSVVAAIDPEEQLKLVGRREIESVARDVRERLERVLQAVAECSE